MNGGQIGFDYGGTLRPAGVVNVIGGSLTNFNTGIGSTITLDGGSLGFVDIPDPSNSILTTIGPVEIGVFSTLNITGGEIAAPFSALQGSTVNLSGGSTFSGQVSLIIDNDGDGVFNLGDEILFFTNQTVGGPDPVVVNVTGGLLGDTFSANANSEINISGGTVGSSFNANALSLVNISGGTVGDDFEAFAGSEVNISGGTVGDDFNAFGGSEINISGGTVGDEFNVFGDSEVNVSGGTIGETFRALDNSVVNLFGSEFSLDDVPLDSLVLDEAFTLAQRDTRLSGLLADGTAFEFDLSVSSQTGDFFSTQAMLTVTLIAAAVPEPTSTALLLVACAGLLNQRRSSRR